jgi:hypothetical protein
MKQAPYLQPWNSYMETYFRYEIEKVGGGIRFRVRPKHVEEEAKNLRKVDSGKFYKKVKAPNTLEIIK